MKDRFNVVVKYPYVHIKDPLLNDVYHNNSKTFLPQIAVIFPEKNIIFQHPPKSAPHSKKISFSLSDEIWSAMRTKPFFIMVRILDTNNNRTMLVRSSHEPFNPISGGSKTAFELGNLYHNRRQVAEEWHNNITPTLAKKRIKFLCADILFNFTMGIATIDHLTGSILVDPTFFKIVADKSQLYANAILVHEVHEKDMWDMIIDNAVYLEDPHELAVREEIAYLRKNGADIHDYLITLRDACRKINVISNMYVTSEPEKFAKDREEYL